MLSWEEVMTLLTEQSCRSPHGGKRTSLSELREILVCLGSPEQHLKFVHVAGTNGKGSASRMLQAVLSAAGIRTGLFISPHLETMNERWTVDGEQISDEELRESAARVRAAVRRFREEKKPDGQTEPAAFALLTLLAFDYFARKECAVVVLEVGIGGRLDSTNVIPVPELALIMNLGLEHTELLGNTIEEIAFEKGGIIKPGGRVVLYHQSEAAERVIRRLCEERGASLTVTEPHLLRTGETGFRYRTHTALRLNLSGRYQRRNMLAVLDGIDVLRSRGWDIPEEAIRLGLGTVTWPGRFEILSENPLVIADGAHNPNGMEALIRSLTAPDSPVAGKRLLFVFGTMADKDVEEMLRLLAPYADGFIMETVHDERAADAQLLRETARRCYGGPVQTASSISAAVDLAMAAGPDTAVICCGSLYQIAAVRAAVTRRAMRK